MIPATGKYLDQILSQTYELWADGLSRHAYSRLWEAQRRTPWGSAHLDRVALVHGDSVVCSAKRYDMAARIDGRACRVLGIGAVFTSPAHRGRGAARHLINEIVEAATADGYDLAALFSEIDPAFYERLDFVRVPLMESRVAVHRRDGAPAMLVRAGDERDLPAIVEISSRRSSGARFALDRSEDLVRFGIARRRLLAGLGPPGLRQVELLVVEEGYTAVAFVICTEQQGRWFIEDAGDRDPDGARLGAMLQAMLGRTPGEPPASIRAWWPLDLRPPQIDVVERYPTREVLMIRPLKEGMRGLLPLDAEAVAYSRLDYF